MPTVDDPRASISRLDTAEIDGIDVPMGTNVTAHVDLVWWATGDVVIERFRDESGHATHHSRRADVTGTVTIEWTYESGTMLFTFDAADLVVAETPEIWPKITRYTEVVR